MLLYFIMRTIIVTHDTCTALNSHQHVVLSPGLVTHQMQSTVETSILDIQIRRDRVIRDSDGGRLESSTILVLVMFMSGSAQYFLVDV